MILMINSETAKQIATQEINRNYRSQFGPLVILDEHTIEKEYGWIFFYSTQKYVESGDFQYALAGNGPIIVEKANGEVHRLGTAKPTEEVIGEFESRRGYSSGRS
jgi:hypothetical protein